MSEERNKRGGWASGDPKEQKMLARRAEARAEMLEIMRQKRGPQ